MLLKDINNQNIVGRYYMKILVTHFKRCRNDDRDVLVNVVFLKGN